ncbi:hypothetical protein HETIRDRAFT_419973 [Heterobasidion irregulare TC 32-1]|uniref:Uncharacterized protein n=1 Tax=Heterobasidion irregulare (strain TC 32-1) TaxID=747525 RepID=W4JYU7_HETIT|nr:uncharacterized protein HETIRDRAFT_419973 [Heterobasidion irregulare TC 32-1]ETW78737.1 hypothetical protein HETIRDRAFT_419973 [Heterobasidion irregulare TC 32-1]
MYDLSSADFPSNGPSGSLRHSLGSTMLNQHQSLAIPAGHQLSMHPVVTPIRLVTSLLGTRPEGRLV